MGREITAKVKTATEQTGTSPVYLIEMAFSTVLRLSTSGDVPWNNFTWLSAPIEVTNISGSAKRGNTASIKIDNSDRAYGALILNEGIRDRAVKIWTLYGDAPHDFSDATPVFQGVMDAAPSIDDSITLNLVSTARSHEKTPSIPLTAFFGPDITYPGTVIEWGDERFILEEARG